MCPRTFGSPSKPGWLSIRLLIEESRRPLAAPPSAGAGPESNAPPAVQTTSRNGISTSTAAKTLTIERM